MYRVLYVDDDDDIREIAEMSLSLREDFEVVTCNSGARALEIAEDWSPHLILLDVMMPDMDGPTTLAAMRTIPSLASTPVVFITARTQASDVERFIALGGKGVIAKPFDPMLVAEQAAAFLT